MLTDTKKDLTFFARQLPQPYERYSIDELANAYCDATDNEDETNKNIYISALILRFWFNIDKMYRSNTVAPSLEHEDFFWWLYEAIEYACKYRGWRDTTKKLNAQQCINKCIETIKLQKYYDMRLAKHKVVNLTVSMDAPLGGEDNEGKTLGDLFETEETFTDHSDDAVISLIQDYVDKNKIIEAILLDTIAFNDVQKHFKKTIKDIDADGNEVRYVEHSSEFWPYRLVQLVNNLPNDYLEYFTDRYNIALEKLRTVIDALVAANNQKIYRYIKSVLSELRITLMDPRVTLF